MTGGRGGPKNLARQKRRSYNCVMNNTGRKTVKGRTTSAPMVAKATAAAKVVANKGDGIAKMPTQEDIARRSYEIFLARGGEHGHDAEDWAQAERELGL